MFQASLPTPPSLSVGSTRWCIAIQLERVLPFPSVSPTLGEISSKFTLALNETGAVVELSFDESSVREDKRIVAWPRSLTMELAVPYQGNPGMSDIFTLNGRRPGEGAGAGAGPAFQFQVPRRFQENWIGNCIALVAQLTADVPSCADLVPPLNERANFPMELARQTGFVPLRRGFSRPAYGLSAVTPNLSNEDEVASVWALSTERFVQYGISGYVEKIAARRIQPPSTIGYIDIRN